MFKRLIIWVVLVLMFCNSLMGNIIDELRVLTESHNDRMEIVRIERIRDLQAELSQFQEENELPWFADWVITNMFDYEKNIEGMLSVIILAMPRPAYGELTFYYNDRQYRAFAFLGADFGRSINYLVEAVQNADFTIIPYSNIPLKRLAVQSGLAEYGRNNIAYVQGMGAKMNLMAFYTNIPLDEDNWREMVVSEHCTDCDICVKVCPTGAIREDNFLLDSHRCLVFLNDNISREIPDWVPSTAHHALSGCLLCQVNCPLNDGMGEVVRLTFSEDETKRILAGAPWDDVIGEFRTRLDRIGITRNPVTVRNLRMLMDLQDEGYVPCLFRVNHE